MQSQTGKDPQSPMGQFRLRRQQTQGRAASAGDMCAHTGPDPVVARFGGNTAQRGAVADAGSHGDGTVFKIRIGGTRQGDIEVGDGYMQNVACHAQD
jgi:hypothetical protein